MTRFQVLTVTGWQIRPNQRAGWNRIAAGLSASVYDSAWDRVIATYRSDEVGITGAVARRKQRTLERAREHAARLEAEYGNPECVA